MGCTVHPEPRARSGPHESPEHRCRVDRGAPRRMPDDGEEREGAAARFRGRALGLPPGASAPGGAAQVLARVHRRHARRRPGVPPRPRPCRHLRQGRPAPARARLRPAPPRRVHRALAPREEGHARSGGGGPAREPPRTHRAGEGGPGLLDRASPGPRDDARPPVRPIARQGVRVPALLRGGRPPAATRRADGFRHRHRRRYRDGLRQEDPPGGCGARRRARSPRTLRGPAPGTALRGALRWGRGGLLRSRQRGRARARPAPARGPP